MHRVLRGSGVVAELYGSWSVDGTDLAVFLEALPDPTDGYVLACEHAAAARDFSDHARSLGEALATVHRILAEKLGTGTLGGSEVAAGFRVRFGGVADEFAEAAAYRARAERVFDEVANTPVPVQRVHGDCHLGQVLLTGGRWIYVDFEGEPLKSLDERRRPDSPLRDVAGMLRSFGYAAAAGDADAGWLEACRAAFLTGYGLDPATPDPLLAGYETDKAGYEVAYEARYRPSSSEYR
nr:phosphotransferase [Tessaracoccus coleopterorum]